MDGTTYADARDLDDQPSCRTDQPTEVLERGGWLRHVVEHPKTQHDLVRTTRGQVLDVGHERRVHFTAHPLNGPDGYIHGCDTEARGFGSECVHAGSTSDIDDGPRAIVEARKIDDRAAFARAQRAQPPTLSSSVIVSRL